MMLPARDPAESIQKALELINAQHKALDVEISRREAQIREDQARLRKLFPPIPRP